MALKGEGGWTCDWESHSARIRVRKERRKKTQLLGGFRLPRSFLPPSRRVLFRIGIALRLRG